MIKIIPPCESCPIHHRGIEKSGEVCRTCCARTNYIAALSDDDILMGRKPLPDMTPPPEAEHIYTAADAAINGHKSSHAPRPRRKAPEKLRTKEGRGAPPGGACRTIMAARRVALGLSQDYVADVAGSTQRTIAAIESGFYNRNPKSTTLRAIATILHLDPGELMKPVGR
jgi:DNA-binding XRE family transcriptional regulator